MADGAVPETARGGPRIVSVLSVGFLVLIQVGGALLALVAGWHAVTARVPISVGGAAGWLRIDQLPQVLDAADRDGTVLLVADLPVWLRLLAYAPQVLSGVCVALAATFGIRTVRAVRRGRPFAPSSIRGIVGAGAALALGGLAYGLIDTLASAAIYRNSLGDDWVSAYEGLALSGGHWPVAQVAVGTAVLVLAGAFREGARLQNETRGLV